MHALYVKLSFAAAHHLRGYRGECKRVHGHNFNVKVVFRANKLNKIGIGKDFKTLKKEVKFFLDKLDHYTLNDLKPFKKENPTAENLAIWLFNSLSDKVNSRNLKVHSVQIAESEKYGTVYYGDQEPF